MKKLPNDRLQRILQEKVKLTEMVPPIDLFVFTFGGKKGKEEKEGKREEGRGRRGGIKVRSNNFLPGA